MPTPPVFDLTGLDSPPKAFNPPSGLSITRKRKQSSPEFEVIGHTIPPRPVSRLLKRDRRRLAESRQGSSAGSSRSGSQAFHPMVAPKVEEDGCINLISDDDDEVVELMRPTSVTPAHRVPPPSRASTSASTSRADGRMPEPSRFSQSRLAPPRPTGSSIFSDFSKIRPGVIVEKCDLESLETEEEYDGFVPENRFAAMETNRHRLQPTREDMVESDNESVDSEDADEMLQESNGASLRSRKHPNSVCPYPTLDTRSSPDGHLVRDMYQQCRNCNPWKIRRLNRPTALRGDWDYARPPLEGELGLENLKLTASFKQCPGSIVCVEQSHGYVAIAGACTGGAEDAPDEVRDAYNREGSLMTYFRQRQCQAVILRGHQNAERFPGRTPEDTEGRTKCYGLTDIKFCPADAHWFVSSGNDRHVKFWQRQSGDTSHKAVIKHKMPSGIPNSLAFKPESRTLAVAERSVFVFPDITSNTKSYNKLEGATDGQVVGEMRWGHGSTDGSLFASSEPTDDRRYTGSWHRFYDVESQKVSVKLATKEAGDAMALDAAGDHLAIVTRTSETKSNLRIYDVRRKNPIPVQEVELEPFELTNTDDEDEAGEHRDAQFSPDGVFIALARYDNRVHIYDRRFTKEKGLLYDLRHSTATKINPGLQPYGVSKLEWVSNGPRLGLVTGGSDGCVRLWNPLEAADNPRNGQPIAIVNSDIASFSLGDRYKGEHQLVVGDCAGEVSIFDRFLNADFPYK